MFTTADGAPKYLATKVFPHSVADENAMLLKRLEQYKLKFQNDGEYNADME